MSRLGVTLAWFLPLGLLLAALVVVPVRIFDESGLPRYRALRTELHAVQAQNDHIRRQVRDLERAVHALRTDPLAVEQVARDELGMVRPDELLFQF